MAMNMKDRRVQKTRKILHEALMALVLEKSYEQISVRDILDRANVGHSTFYTHYKDKDELLLIAFDALADELRAAQANMAKSSTRGAARLIGFSQAMFAHAERYRAIYLALIRSQAGPIVRQRIQRVISDLIAGEAGRQIAPRNSRDQDLPLSLLIQYLASTMMTVLSWWAEQKSNVRPESVDRLYRSLVMPTLAANFV